MALRPEFVTQIRCATVLPDDGIVNRLAVSPVPYHCCLALVRDADCSNVRAVSTASGNHFRRHTGLSGPYLSWIMLHPAGPWKDLGEFLEGRGYRLPVASEKDGPRACRSLIKGENVFLLHGACSCPGKYGN